MPNALLVYPKNPVTFWSFDEALKIAGKKCSFQPAGLLTVAGMLPERYAPRVIDENVEPLRDTDLEWADVVLTSSMIIHLDSLEEIIKRAKEHRKPVLSGGPLATQYFNDIKGDATFFLGEAEAGFVDTLDEIVRQRFIPGKRVVDKRKKFESLNNTPLQRFDLIKDNLQKYASMAIQITRGCPESCTFCNIPSLYGKKTRLKSASDVIQELQLLYDLKWRGSVMIVDDNIVGNQTAIIPILKETAHWQERHNYPFSLHTQGSLRMYEDPKLMDAMYQAGFNLVFWGLESPAAESLKAMGAQKNLQATNERGRRSMLEKVREIQKYYFRGQAGFIIGFDADPPDIAKRMKAFIDESRISVAMVGPLGVLPDTPDWIRYSRDNRLVESVRYNGDSGLFAKELSYIPRYQDGSEMDPEIVLGRHREVVQHINSPENYFARTLDYIKHRERKPIRQTRIDFANFKAAFRSFYYQGIKSDYKKTYWDYLWKVASHDLRDIPDAITYAVEGHHLITLTKKGLEEFKGKIGLEKSV